MSYVNRFRRPWSLLAAVILSSIAVLVLVIGPGVASASGSCAGTSLSSLATSQGLTDGGVLTVPSGDSTVYVDSDAEASFDTGESLAVASDANLTLDLCGNSVTFDPGSDAAGIAVPVGSSLTIEDTSSGQAGSLDATGVDGNPGIGGGGNVTISGGVISAYGGEEGGAAIGDAADDSASGTTTITISGGSVTADGGEDGGAAIGQGEDDANADNVTISGGVVQAYGGENGGAGIGGGDDGSANATTVTIDGGSVTAFGGGEDPGIGTGAGNTTAYTVDLSGGLITARGGSEGPGIGSGAGATTPTLNVTAQPSGTPGTDGGESTSSGTAATIADNSSSSLYYTAVDTEGNYGEVVVTFLYPVSFDLNGYGSGISQQLVAYGSEVTEPSTPAASGYSFVGWYSDSGLSTVFDFADAITPSAPVTLYADWAVLPPAAPDAPTITATVSGTKGKDGWYVSPVTVTFTCTDASATPSCTGPVTLSKSGAGQSVFGTSTATDDGGSNSASKTVSGIDIDLTKPAVRITGVKNHASYRHAAPKSACKASDAVSGVASCKLTKTTHKTKTGYTETLTATATSKAGTTATTSVKYTVKTK